MVTDARGDLTKLAKALRADVDDLQKAMTKPPTRKPAATRSRTAKSTAASKR
jgi:hypothetical protein